MENFLNEYKLPFVYVKFVYDDNYEDNDLPIDIEILEYNDSYVEYMESIPYFKNMYKETCSLKKLTFIDAMEFNNFINKCILAIQYKISQRIVVYNNQTGNNIQFTIVPMKNTNEKFVISIYSLDDKTNPFTHMQNFFIINENLLIVTDSVGKIVTINPKASMILGYMEYEVLDRNIQEFLVSKNLDINDIIFNIDSFIEINCNIKCKNGLELIIKWSINKYKGYMYFTGVDVTEYFKKEEELSKQNENLYFINDKLSKINSELKEENIKDSLTGVYNRKYFDIVMDYEFKCIEESNTPLSLVICDIDNFKKINDVYGHPAGDWVLTYYSKLMKNSLKDKIKIFRIGGEEFALVFSGYTSHEAKEKVEYLLDEIRKHPNDICGVVTFSFGISEYFEDDTFEELYKRVDKALYYAKKTGKNRVVLFSEIKLPKDYELKFKDDYNTNIIKIDENHRIIFNYLNEFLKLTSNMADKNQIIEIADKIYNIFNLHYVEVKSKFRKNESNPYLYSYDIDYKKIVQRYEFLRKKYLENKILENMFYLFVYDDIVMDYILDRDYKLFSYLSNIREK